MAAAAPVRGPALGAGGVSTGPMDEAQAQKSTESSRNQLRGRATIRSA